MKVKEGSNADHQESSPDVRTIHLHVVTKDNIQWNDYILFRDTLRNDAEVRMKYGDFKRKLASKFPRDRESYTSGKNEFIQGILREKDEQIKALLSWFGSGAGPWSGFPSYESAAEELLLDYEIVEIVDVLKTHKLTPEQTEGAARLFSGWSFRRKYPGGIRSVPDDLREVLMNHVNISGDKDKLERAKRAFK
ncbi:MAG: GrpB family protein [Candidatus Aegiribacteria sp.]|nr:GrpB family protein [Candidatus Aegiribacteria sp.]